MKVCKRQQGGSEVARRKTLAELKDDEQKLHARIQRLEEAQNKKNRDRRNHGLIVMGSFIEKYWFDGDWTTADIRQFREYVKKWANSKDVKECKQEPTTPEEANIEIRKFERELRDAAAKRKQEE